MQYVADFHVLCVTQNGSLQCVSKILGVIQMKNNSCTLTEIIFYGHTDTTNKISSTDLPNSLLIIVFRETVERVLWNRWHSLALRA